MQSESIGKLAEALSKTQGEMKAPSKGRTGKIKGTTKDGRPYEYEYKYADLSDVIECRKVGAKHGLAITQGMELREGDLALSTMLMHLSGEWKSWDCPIPAGLKPQELGSYLTYMRRYSECGAWGIAAEDDDDGKQAQDAEPAKPAAASAPRPAAVPKAPESGKPPCPKCGQTSSVIESKFKRGDWVCWTKARIPGCGAKFGSGDMFPAPEPSEAELGAYDVPDEVPF